MSLETFKETWRHTDPRGLKPINIKLETYTGDPVKVICATHVRVRYQQLTKKLPLIVVKGDGSSLLGRGWLEEIYLDWREIKTRCKAEKVHQIKTTENTLQQVLNKYEDVFKEEFGNLKGPKATTPVKRDAIPRFSAHGLFHLPCEQK